MEKLVCDRCGIEYTDIESIDMAKRYKENWEAQCERDGEKPRGIIPCPNVSCTGEMILKEEDVAVPRV